MSTYLPTYISLKNKEKKDEKKKNEEPPGNVGYLKYSSVCVVGVPAGEQRGRNRQNDGGNTGFDEEHSPTHPRISARWETHTLSKVHLKMKSV